MHPTLTGKRPVQYTEMLAMAEYARQSFHLAHGGSGRRGEIVEKGRTRALWCRRTDTMMSTLLCAILASDQDDLALVRRLLTDHRPDAAIFRRIDATSMEPMLRLRQGAIFLSLGLVEVTEILSLPADFESFLAGLGKRTRTHIRSSLRQIVRQGFHHSVTVGARAAVTEEILSLARRNLPKSTPRGHLDDCLRDVNAQAKPFQSELRAADGRLISIIFGYLDSGHAMQICQLNPYDAPRIGQAGCSLLHRALLIRDLTERKMKSLIMVNGCSGMLRPYCLRVTAETLFALSLSPLSWLRCLIHFFSRPNLWTFLFGGLTARRRRP